MPLGIEAYFLCGAAALSAALAVCLSVSSCQAAATERPAANGLLAHYDADRVMGFSARVRLDSALDELVNEPGTYQVPGLGVIVYKNGREVYSHFVGSSHIDAADPRANVPITRDTRFRMASLSKMFTAFTLMQLVEQGKLRLDDDASKYLGFPLRNPAYPDTPITLEMLASHTSSLRNGGDKYLAPPDVNIREFFIPQGRKWDDGVHFAPKGEAPGEFFCYCDLNYGVLGTILETVTGERFDRYQKKHILNQLSTMADYFPGNLSCEAFLQLGTIYRRLDDNGQFDETAPWRSMMDDYRGRRPKRDTLLLDSKQYSFKGYVPGTNATLISPQGGLRATLEEMTHPMEMLMNDGVYRGRRILPSASVAEILRPHWVYDPVAKNGDTYDGALLAYGLGEYPIYGDSGARVCRDFPIDLVGHTGEAHGLLSGMFFRPGTKDGFVYVLNGLAVELDKDPRCFGQFSGNYIWEEKIMEPICQALWGKEFQSAS